MEQIVNGELGSSVRNKLNLLITKYNSTRSVRNVFNTTGIITPSTNVVITSRDLFDEVGIGTNGVIEADITNTSTNIVLNGLPNVIEADNNHFIGATVKTLETSSVTLQVIDGDDEENVLGSIEIESTSEYKDVIIPIKPSVSINNPYIKILIDSSESVNNISIKDIVAVKTDEFLGYSTPVIDKKTIDLTTKSIADTATLNEVSLKVNNKIRIELNELPDGERTLFTASKIFLAGTADVYANRLKQYKGTGVGFDYTEASANSIEFSVAPKAGVVLALEAADVSSEKIVFKDSIVKGICATNWGSDGEITYEQAAAVTDLGTVFCYWSDTPPTEQITSFEELQYFTAVTSLDGNNEGWGTFSQSNLKAIRFPKYLESIGFAAFGDCYYLTELSFPQTITNIGVNAFQSCFSLRSINIPNSVASIGSGAFYNCRNLTHIDISASITSIEETTFGCCYELTTITIYALIPPTLGADAFISDTNLAHIYVPNASVDAYKEAAGWSDYAAIISAINPPR